MAWSYTRTLRCCRELHERHSAPLSRPSLPSATRSGSLVVLGVSRANPGAVA